jgi:hypothetical protein
MRWWEWARALTALTAWVRSLIGSERPYTIEFRPGGGSYVDAASKRLVVDPTMVDAWGGRTLLPLRWRRWTLRTLEQLQWHAARALARHEAAHILFTESWPVRGVTHGRLMNALEDGRIERLLGALYPWCWQDFLPLGQLASRATAATIPAMAAGAARILPLCLLHRWDGLRPKGTASLITFINDDDRGLWEGQIRPLVEEAWKAPTCARVGEIAAEILAILGLSERDSLMAGAIVIVTGADDGFLPAGAERDPGDGALAIVLGETDGPPGESSLEEADASPPGPEVDTLDESLWPQPYRQIEGEVIGDARRLARDLTPPTPDIDVRASMAFGRFSARQHVRTQGEQPLLRRREEAPDPSGLAVALLIDRTGSMGNAPGEETRDGPTDPGSFFNVGGRMVHARRAGILIERACALAQPPVPLAIGYAGDRVWRQRPGWSDAKRRRPSPVAWIKRFETPPQAEAPRALLAGMYGDSGDEAVSRSLRLAAAELSGRPEGTRLIIYIHDGRPTDESPEAAAATVRAVRGHGYHVVGLFVGSQSEYRLLSGIFGADHTVGVEDLRRLPERLGQLVRRYWRTT